MQQPGILGQYSWELLEDGSEATPAAAAPPPPPPGEAFGGGGEVLTALFAAMPQPEDTTDVATASGFEATQVPAGEAVAHGGGCACGACAMPGYDDTQLGELAGIDLAAGPEGAVIDATVTQSVVPTGGVGIAYGDTFKLHSNPGSKLTVFLDFDGHTTTGTTWNSYWSTSSFYSPAFSTDTSETFNTTELLRIQQIWARVAEYFSPFNVNVTTQDPGVEALRYSGSSDTAYGIRVVITDEGGKNFGGIAYKNSFMWNVDTPVFVYSNRLADGAKSIADAAAHEIGHSMGLDHDGRNTSEYYYGHGSGATDWAPVLGVGYNANIVQWSKGEYNGATNTQDDLSIITTRNGAVTYRADDHGNTFSSASALGGTVAGGVATVETFGVITGSGSRNDVDMFSFQLGGTGAIDLTVSGWTRAYVSGSSTPVYTASPFSMLDVALTLYNDKFQQVATWNEVARIDGVLKLSGLAAGTYYLGLDGVGVGDPMAATPTGYTDYGSLGQYMIRGTYTVADTSSGSTGGSTGGSTDTGTSGSTDTGLKDTGGASLTVDRTSLTTVEGGTQTVTLRAVGATGDVLVATSGLNAAEGKLAPVDIVLSAANNWTASVAVTGVDDRNVDGSVGYALQFSADGFGSQTVSVTNQDNDKSAAAAGTIVGTYKTKPSVNNGTVAVQSADDGRFTTWREGVFNDGKAGIELRWQFNGLTAGDKLVQVDAWSGVEAFRFEYSVDNAATWRLFDGASAGSLAWNTDLLATGVGSSLWVRLVDTDRTDTSRDTFGVDLITVTDKPSSIVDDTGGGTGGGGASDGGTGDGGTGDGGTGGGTGGDTGGTGVLSVSRSALTTAEGQAASFTISTTGATGDVKVSITGVNAAEGALDSSEVVLNALNGWTATVEVTGTEDRNADADVAYALQVAAAGYTAQTVTVTNANDDVSALTAGTIVGNYTTRPNINNASVAVQAADDGRVTTWREGFLSDGSVGIELRWEFTGLSAGNKLVQVDAWSSVELFRFEYSVDGAATWRGFDGAADAALRWNTDLVATDVGSNLWVRLLDTVRTDTVNDTISLDLITVAPADHLFG
ncbi:hypothetical protein DFH01_14060 [Falsiroseomonas bella]|uniref:Uncharacterized protein n=1 Tax=Falsiroseomonas bella TaxID=2184016 RepID=A0A317FE67_9PROT|nr:zinc-dependent metalloprotease family protein [Falsiroseomonas bella]PWS36297.1 hypothetical protein DFH01_14060 [Falsiroseomonas bella]